MNKAVQISSRPQVLSRPKTVPIVAAFLFAATFIASVVGVSLLFPNRLLDMLWKLNPEGAILFHSIGPVSGVFLIALAATTLAAARGLLGGRRWAWWFSVTLFGLDACGNVVSYFLVHDALRAVTGAIISSAFLITLGRRSTRCYFLRQELTPNHKL
jgi:hypothetical protein